MIGSGSTRAGRGARPAPLPSLPSLLACAAALAGFLAIALAWSRGGGAWSVEWAPTLGLELAFRLDGLGALYGLMATGIGFLVFAYAAPYMPAHLAEQGRPRRDEWSFFGLMVLFMAAMVGLATAEDAVLLFVFFDLTTVASYLLIGYDRGESEARRAALVAMLVTGVAAVLLLIAVVVLGTEYGTFSLPELFDRARPGPLLTVASALIAVAGLAKSAQVPLHLWLPRAMAAPTPVSAYLHSAAMVAAGVLLIGRFHPLLALSPPVLDGLLVVGFASMAVGGILALTRDTLKQVLAYSTISQYGYVVAMYGLGGGLASVGAAFYVLSHALAKSALFLAAGAITQATGENRLSRLGGLARSSPLLAAASAVAALGLAGLPLTIGFFKDELFFGSALEHGTAVTLAAVAGVALTLAYVGRFWAGLFLGPAPGHRPSAPASLVAPVVALAVLVLAGGVVVSPFLRLAEAAGSVTLGAPAAAEAAYHLDLRPENLMALAAYALGAGALASQRLWRRAALAFSRAGEIAGPDRVLIATIRGLNGLSDRVHALEVRDLRTRIVAVLVPGGLLLGLGVLTTPFAGAYRIGAVRAGDAALVFMLAVAAVTATAATVARKHVTIGLTVSAVGFSLAVVYAFFGAPDVALVAVLIETVLTLLVFGIFTLLPRDVLRREASLPTSRSRRWRDPVVALAAGASAFAVVWGVLSRHPAGPSVAAEQLRLAPEAHAGDVVTAILADFRGLDTLVEVTVIAVALIGVAGLVRQGRFS